METRLAGRLLTYSEGRTIHWGDRTIDVEQQAHGRQVGYVDATDDGAVFVIDHALVRDEVGWGMPYGPAAVWFTDGSAPIRIGTTSGSSVRGFGIAPSAEGSTLAWTDPGTEAQPAQMVVNDTARMREVARFGGPDAEPLAVYDDVVYWSPGDAPCAMQADFGCLRTRWVMRFDKASGRQSRVNWADYEADRRTRPGLLTGPYDGDAHVRGDVDYDSIGFARRADRLVGWSRGVEIPLTVAMTGQPLRLHLPTAYTPSRRYSHGMNLSDLTIAQWLDADRVVLADDDTTDLLVCRLSTGGCRVAVRIPGDNYLAAGPFISHG